MGILTNTLWELKSTHQRIPDFVRVCYSILMSPIKLKNSKISVQTQGAILITRMALFRDPQHFSGLSVFKYICSNISKKFVQFSAVEYLLAQ